jgi:hypothetical protein
MPNVDALAEQNYSAYDPQFADVEAEERASINDALDEVISTLTVAVNEMEAVKQNFTTRKYNMFILALNEMIDELEGAKDD